VGRIRFNDERSLREYAISEVIYHMKQAMYWLRLIEEDAILDLDFQIRPKKEPHHMH